VASRERQLVLHRPAFGESLTLRLDTDGRPVGVEGRQIDWFLRDHDGAQTEMDLGLVPLIAGLTDQLAWLLGSSPRLEVIEAFVARPDDSDGARREDPASKALHSDGRAVDLRVNSCPPRCLHEAGTRIPGGGIGVFMARGVVHLDTGDWRRWSRRLA
jgi:uncharacterized protein YcbK (DUF882 family)